MSLDVSPSVLHQTAVGLARTLPEPHLVPNTQLQAHIMYMTGEAEELDLDEIVKEGHLTLHTM